VVAWRARYAERGLAGLEARRGSFPSVPDLITAIRTFIDAWNERCQPFVWTKTADEVLAKAKNTLASSDGPLAHRVEQRALTRVCGVRASGVPSRRRAALRFQRASDRAHASRMRHVTRDFARSRAHEPCRTTTFGAEATGRAKRGVTPIMSPGRW
jgi:hypothetical protein